MNAQDDAATSAPFVLLIGRSRMLAAAGTGAPAGREGCGECLASRIEIDLGVWATVDVEVLLL